MKITRARVFEVKGEQRSGLALYAPPAGPGFDDELDGGKIRSRAEL